MPTNTASTANPESLTVVPAYGRDYKNRREVLAAWEGGKDFLIQDVSSLWDGKYVSCRDFAGRPADIKVRYRRLECVMFIKWRPAAPGARLFIVTPCGDPGNPRGYNVHECQNSFDDKTVVFRGDLSPHQGRDATARMLRRLYPGAQVRVRKCL